jgi:hypothetical protein
MARSITQSSKTRSSVGLGNQAQNNNLKKLSNNALLARLDKLRGQERAVLLKILRYLNEVDRRRLYLPHGYGSLFDFCTGYLKYSSSAAGRRIHAARCIERFPQVAEMLRTGEVTLSAVSTISAILTRENAGEILSWIRGKSTREIEMLVSRYRPKRFLRDRVKPICLMTEYPGPGDNSANDNKLHTTGPTDKCKASLTITPGAGSKCKAGLTSIVSGGGGVSGSSGTGGSCSGGGGSETGPSSVTGDQGLEKVLITQKFKLEFAVDPAFMKKLARVRSLLSSKYPKGISFEMLFDILMDEYLHRSDPKNRNKKRSQDRFKSRKVHKDAKQSTARIKPARSSRSGNTARSSDHTRHIPQSIRDKIFERDGGRCSYIGKDGTRCNSDWNLQIDHIVPYAKGGDSSPDNLRLLCAKHNRLAAEREYGRKHMDRFCRRE